ncbi:hypothetical protein [Flavobacterium flavigenum]|nr:hypothetical protein [Flavobacterium flavigenum]
MSLISLLKVAIKYIGIRSRNSSTITALLYGKKWTGFNISCRHCTG